MAREVDDRLGIEDLNEFGDLSVVLVVQIEKPVSFVVNS